jgi:hypothetical protein
MSAKLSSKQRADIVFRYMNGESSGVVAKDFGVQPEYVRTLYQRSYANGNRAETHTRLPPTRASFHVRLDPDVFAIVETAAALSRQTPGAFVSRLVAEVLVGRKAA